MTDNEMNNMEEDIIVFEDEDGVELYADYADLIPFTTFLQVE